MIDATADDRVIATAMPGTFTAYAWHRLATDPHARGLSAIRKLTFLAVAHHADQASHTPGGYQASTAADLVDLTWLPFTALIPALAALQASGWLDGDEADGYRPPAAAVAFTRGESFDGTSAAVLTASHDGCEPTVPAATAAEPPTG